MIILDVPYVFRVAGGPSALRLLLATHDHRPAPPSYATIQMWFQRRSIPARWIAPVLYALSREGHDLLSLFLDTELLASAHPNTPAKTDAEADIFG